jgi:DNA-binding transcriptional LysR family regulator
MGYGSAAPLDLRKLRYFVAVAEELHFGRAADRLYITQPVLSRQVRQLEQELGTDLLDRSSRRVELTEAGRLLLEEARALLSASDAARRRMKGVADGVARLRIGFFVGDNFAEALRIFQAEQPEKVELELHRIYWDNQVDVLHDGRVDVAFTHLPVDRTGLEMLPVRAEPRVAVLPADHPEAERDTTTIAALAEDPVIIQRGATDAWQAFHNVDPRPDGRHPIPGPAVDCIEEKLELVAAGQGISFVPASSAAVYLTASVSYVLVSDIPPIQICLAWRENESSPLVRSFVAAVEAAARRPDFRGSVPPAWKASSVPTA